VPSTRLPGPPMTAGTPNPSSSLPQRSTNNKQQYGLAPEKLNQRPPAFSAPPIPALAPTGIVYLQGALVEGPYWYISGVTCRVSDAK
jgi:hypothetical protein